MGAHSYDSLLSTLYFYKTPHETYPIHQAFLFSIGLFQTKIKETNIKTFFPLEKRPNIDHLNFDEEKVNKWHNHLFVLHLEFLRFNTTSH